MVVVLGPVVGWVGWMVVLQPMWILKTHEAVEMVIKEKLHLVLDVVVDGHWLSYRHRSESGSKNVPFGQYMSSATQVSSDSFKWQS